jgi:hypothetical protein
VIRHLASIQKVREDIFDLHVRNSDEYLEDPEGTKEYEYDLFVQCQKEHDQQMQLCPQVKHADIGYRVHLALALQKVDDHDERVKILDSIFLQFQYLNGQVIRGIF